MILKNTRIRIKDNSGALVIKCFNIARTKWGKIGGLIKGSITKHRPHKKVKLHQKLNAVLITTKKGWQRKNGSYVKFDENRAVVLNPNSGRGTTKKKLPQNTIGNRILSHVARELKWKKRSKIVALSKGLC